MVFCIDCHDPITHDVVHLTATSSMCRECYEESMAAWHDEKHRHWGGRADYLPSPVELHQRIEQVRQEIGMEPRYNMQPTLSGTMLYEGRR